MSLYEELLTLGSDLRETERVALYQFLLSSKREKYLLDAQELMSSHTLKREIANGEIRYSLNGTELTYSAKKKGESGYLENLRSLRLSKFSKLRLRKIVKFLAQSEVDVIWNYPAQADESQEEGSFSIISIPYFDLRYYSENRSRVIGFFNKMKSVDSEILSQLKSQ